MFQLLKGTHHIQSHRCLLCFRSYYTIAFLIHSTSFISPNHLTGAGSPTRFPGTLSHHPFLPTFSLYQRFSLPSFSFLSYYLLLYSLFTYHLLLYSLLPTPFFSASFFLYSPLPFPPYYSPKPKMRNHKKPQKFPVKFHENQQKSPHQKYHHIFYRRVFLRVRAIQQQEPTV